VPALERMRQTSVLDYKSVRGFQGNVFVRADCFAVKTPNPTHVWTRPTAARWVFVLLQRYRYVRATLLRDFWKFSLLHRTHLTQSRVQFFFDWRMRLHLRFTALLKPWSKSIVPRKLYAGKQLPQYHGLPPKISGLSELFRIMILTFPR
jgi:hypothetical protein